MFCIYNDLYVWQGWGEYYSGTRLAQNDKHEYTKNIVLEYYSSTDFPVLVLVCSVLAPDLMCGHNYFPVVIFFTCIANCSSVESKHIPRPNLIIVVPADTLLPAGDSL